MSSMFRRRKGGLRIDLQVGDATWDDWSVVAGFSQLETARAFCQRLREAGFAAEITSDWPLDRFGRGDVALRVPPEDAIAAEEWLGEPDADDADGDGDLDWLRDD